MYKVFNGKFKGTGIVFDRNGLIIDSFVIDLDVLWEDPNSFSIKEKTIFSNKEVKERSWIYKLKNNNEIEAGTDDKIGLNLGNDIVDVARGSIAGNARYLNYVFRAKIVDKNSVVKDKKTKDSNEVANLNNSVGNDSSKQEIKTIDLDVRDFLYMIDENHYRQYPPQIKLYVSCINECPIEGRIDNDIIVIIMIMIIMITIPFKIMLRKMDF
jgi:hypothetical protein